MILKNLREYEMNRKKRKPKTWFWVLIAVMFIPVVIGCSGREESKESASSTQEDMPLEYQLAVINKGGYVAENDQTVIQFENLLVSLDKKCEETPLEIADVSVVVQTRLKESSINLPLLKIMQDLDNSIPLSDIKLKLVEVAAAYIILVKNQ